MRTQGLRWPPLTDKGAKEAAHLILNDPQNYALWFAADMAKKVLELLKRKGK